MVLVNTSSGPVLGTTKTTILNDTYFSFQQIRYAEPPINDLRFRDPIPVRKWIQPLDCTKEGPQCWSYNPTSKILEGNEDCLYLNIFTKEINPKNPMPVMVYIHGGAFMWGFSGLDRYSPDYLLHSNVILITVNYRVGAFGFLSSDDPELQVPGNAGLKDQSLALKWIKLNCHNFGGDSTNITLFGESAGGSSVHYHMISTLSKELFHKAIIMSGCVQNHWSLVQRKNMLKRLAIKLGWHENGNEHEALTYLRSANASDIAAVQLTLPSTDELENHQLFPFGPTIESYKSEHGMVLESPTEMCKTAWGNKIPTMIGYTSEEGLFLYNRIITNPKLMEYILPTELVGLEKESEQNILLRKRLQKFYMGNESNSTDSLSAYLNYISDFWFLHGLYRACASRLKYEPNVPTYFYRFNYDSETFNHFRNNTCGSGVRGACHADDLSYLFKNSFVTEIDYNSNEFKTIKRMVSLWTKFAETGNPNSDCTSTVEWKPLQNGANTFKCLNINEDLTFIDCPEQERMELWNSLYEGNPLF